MSESKVDQSTIATDKLCCLGCLCEVFVDRGKLQRVVTSGTPFYTDDKFQYMARRYPPDEVIEWAGIDRNAMPSQDIVLYLANVNDNGSNFEYIIGEIEQWL